MKYYPGDIIGFNYNNKWAIVIEPKEYIHVDNEKYVYFEIMSLKGHCSEGFDNKKDVKLLRPGFDRILSEL